MANNYKVYKDACELSPIKAIELAAAQTPGAISLAQGIPSFATPQCIREFVTEKIDQGACDKYSLTPGLLELREEIAIALIAEGLHYDPELEIIATAGAIEGITATFLGLTTPGDEVILPSPTYTSYQNAIQLAGCKPVFVELDEDRNFDFCADRLANAITRKTRAIFYCNPNNPTGTVISEASTAALVELCSTHNLYLITDEVYKDFYYGGHQHCTPAKYEQIRDRVVRICSFSKAYAMTGWRIGFLHADQSNVKRILRFHDSLVTCAPVVSQYAAIAALRLGDKAVQEFRAEFKRRRDFTLEALDSLSHVLDYQMPHASYFVFPRIKDSVPHARDSTHLAYDILERAKLALVPGVAFGPSGERHLRISFGREMSDVERGMQRLADYFSAALGRTRVLAPASDVVHTCSTTQRNANQLLTTILGLGARVFLKRNKPMVIGIAGTIGKTLYKREIEEQLAKKYRVRANQLSHNTEIGLPLSILKLVVPRSWWDKICFPLRFLTRSVFGADDVDILILEYGIRNANDAKRLLHIVQPDWLVVTDITGTDPSLDYREIGAGVHYLVGHSAPERTLWSAEDDTVQQLSDRFLAQHKLSLAAYRNGTISTPNAEYQVTKDLVGKSARLAHVAALRLVEELS